ncbi:MAG: HAD-IIIC family phosphatase, partial [Gemmatimonadetes bacterium]|nr:HAD-IIIC family phosphatase [Gemmatimonadota bacterium]
AWRIAAGSRDPKDVWKVHRRLGGLPDDELPRATVAFLGDSTLDFAAAHLQVAAFRDGLNVRTYVAPFGQYVREILDPSSGLHAAGADLVIVDVRGETLFPGLYGITPAAEAPDPEVHRAEYAAQLRTLAEGCRAFVMAHGFIAPGSAAEAASRWEADGAVRRVHALNQALADELRDIPNFRLFDMDGFAARAGKARLRNTKMWHLGKVAVDEAHLPDLADDYLRTLKPLRGLNRKLLVLDLDGTLWGGVLGEAGADGIRIAPDGPGAPFADFQREARRLQERGIALALCSKNNEADVLPVLREHPGMVLRPEHFAAWRINWTDKVENLRALAEEVNVGLDSVVFLDDNPVERENVRMRLPEVLVPELPADPVEYAPFLAGLTDFDPLRLTEEDRRRGAMYAEEKQRRDVRAEAPDLSTYLRTLETVVRVRPAREAEMERVQQLMMKTNQFNTTTLRWQLPDIARFLGERGVWIHVAEVRDRFGDSGLCGVCLSRVEGGRLEIVGLMLSCRVLGRGVEDAFLRAVIHALAGRADRSGGGPQAEPVRTVAGEIVFTEKNLPVRGLFAGNGMECVAEDVNRSRWEADIRDVSPDGPDWIRVEWQPDPGSPAPEQPEAETA